jgi:predicted kinase
VAEALFVVVSGPPASGESTLAPVLARELALPLVAKDTIKDALMSVLPVADVDASRHIGRGAVAAMLAVAADSRSER